VDYLSKYTIAFKGLKEGDHLFDFDIDDKFFGRFENSEVAKGSLTAKVKLTRQSTLLVLKMEVKGTVELQCDRCLDNYLQKVKNKGQLYVKFGEEEEEIGDEIIVIPFEEHQVNVAQYLYELVILGLPIKHVHPADSEGKSTCNPEMLEKLKEYIIDERDEEEQSPVDERWSELKKLLDNK
jgi:uncharacterized protein